VARGKGTEAESPESLAFGSSFRCFGFRIYIAPCSREQSSWQAASMQTGDSSHKEKTWHTKNIECIIYRLTGDYRFPASFLSESEESHSRLLAEATRRSSLSLIWIE